MIEEKVEVIDMNQFSHNCFISYISNVKQFCAIAVNKNNKNDDDGISVAADKRQTSEKEKKSSHISVKCSVC
jgi:hypothetical protein